MIVRDRPNSFKLLFVLRGSIAQRIIPQIAVVSILGLVVAELYVLFPSYFPEHAAASFTVLGVALSVFLGFRNNTCYDRWWEARKAWGQMIVDTRSLARQVTNYIDSERPGGKEAQRRIIELAIAFAHGMRYQLRDYDCWDDARKYLSEEDIELIQPSQNHSNTVLHLLGKEVGTCYRHGLLTDEMVRMLDMRLTSLAQVQATCERIKNTPVPFAYTLLLHRTAYIYCVLLPFGLVAPLGFAAPVISAVVAYAFFGLDALGEELEEPFGERPNNLALQAMSRTIEINMLEALGDATPESITPVDYYLP